MASGRTREEVIRIRVSNFRKKFYPRKNEMMRNTWYFAKFHMFRYTKKGNFVTYPFAERRSKRNFVSFHFRETEKCKISLRIILRYFFLNTTKRETDGCYGKLWQAEQIKRHFIQHFVFPDVSFRFASLREKIAVSRNTKFHATALYFAKQRNSFGINFAKQNFTGNFSKMVGGRT